MPWVVNCSLVKSLGGFLPGYGPWAFNCSLVESLGGCLPGYGPWAFNCSLVESLGGCLPGYGLAKIARGYWKLFAHGTLNLHPALISRSAASLWLYASHKRRGAPSL